MDTTMITDRARAAACQQGLRGCGVALALRAGARVATRLALTGLALAGAWVPAVQAQDTVCAKVKIEIKQELTLERQAFDAQMKISNSTDTGLLENVAVEVKVSDEAGTPVRVSSDPNDLSAKFFIRISGKQDISAVDGTGTVRPKSTAVINWLLIPAAGAAGNNPLGKKFLVGATLKYRYAGEDSQLDVSPDVIKVKPLPQLTLDYFLPQEVEADDPLTPEIEPVQPFTLGVRVKNNGVATAKNLKIDSAQPKIIENKQGLLIGFKLTGSFVNDAPAQNSLLTNFGDVAGNSSKTARWIMETTLSGKFTEFSARFSHADELGGALTSILQATNAHALVRDVRVDLPGRDQVRDFLAKDGDIYRVYESEGLDTEVSDRSAVAVLNRATDGSGNFTLQFPPTAGFAYARVPDPMGGQSALGMVMRSDAKTLSAENVWLSRTRNADTKKWEYWINVFDANTTGSYSSKFAAPPVVNQPPTLQFIPDRVVAEGQQVSFLVEATGFNGKPVQISVAPLPTGAKWLPQASDPAAPNLARAVFDWTPAAGTKGSYLLVYTATDGILTATRQAKITVTGSSGKAGPGLPQLAGPLAGARLMSRSAALAARFSSLKDDPSTTLYFELYADATMTQLLGSASQPKLAANAANASYAWTIPFALNSNQRYWWRVRAGDGQLYSPWVDGWFFVNYSSTMPDGFNLSLPSEGSEVGTRTPILRWNNSKDVDGDSLLYEVSVCRDKLAAETIPADNGYCDGAGNQLMVARGANIPAGANGASEWMLNVPLEEGKKYVWRVSAMDPRGSRTSSPFRSFTVNSANTPPTTPTTPTPANAALLDTLTPTLSVQNSSDAQGDAIRYVFEIDSVNSFDSADRRSSGLLSAGNGGSTSWTPPALSDGKTYWWRVKAMDARAESGWLLSSFRLRAQNHAPATPSLRRPGDGAWVAVSQPSLQLFTAPDPDGDAVSYEFEVYADAALSQKVANGSSSTPNWIVNQPLIDKFAYWWRARAVDEAQLASAWSAPQKFDTRLTNSLPPVAALLTPDMPVTPQIVSSSTGNRSLYTLRYELADPTADTKIALYYKPVTLPLPTSSGDDPKAAAGGTLIVDGLKPANGSAAGSYDWDLTGLAAGTYYVYALAYTSAGSSFSYAPGAVVVPTASTPNAKFAGPSLVYVGGSASYGMSFTGQVLAPMQMPFVSKGLEFWLPEGMTYQNAQNTSGTRLFTGFMPVPCFTDNMLPRVEVGGFITEDPAWVGRTLGAAPRLSPANDSNTDASDIRICRLRVLAETPVDASLSDYQIVADLANSGAGLASVEAVPVVGTACTSAGVVSGKLRFGAVGSKEIGHGSGTVTLRAKSGVAGAAGALTCAALRWSLTITR